MGAKKERRRKTQTRIKAILSLSIVSFWFLCLPIMAKEKTSMNTSYPNKKNGNESIIVEISITPLEKPLKIGEELFRLIKTKDTSEIERINFALTRAYINPVSFQNLNKSIKSKKLENSLFTNSLIVYTFLNAADYVTTLKALKYESLQEGNPFMKPIVKNPYIFAAVKFGMTALNFKLMKELHKKDKRISWVVSTIINFSLSYVVINNIRMIKKVQNM